MVTCSRCRRRPPVDGLKVCQSCRDYKREYMRNRSRSQAHAEGQARYRAKRRREVIEGYGGACACCGESEPAFLTIDHVNGGGRQDRKTTAGHTLYTRLRRLLPKRLPEFQVLCWNCNAAKHFQGTCPHQRV